MFVFSVELRSGILRFYHFHLSLDVNVLRSLKVHKRLSLVVSSQALTTIAGRLRPWPSVKISLRHQQL